MRLLGTLTCGHQMLYHFFRMAQLLIIKLTEHGGDIFKIIGISLAGQYIIRACLQSAGKFDSVISPHVLSPAFYAGKELMGQPGLFRGFLLRPTKLLPAGGDPFAHAFSDTFDGYIIIFLTQILHPTS